MGVDFFHACFLLFSFCMIWVRAYYVGYVDAQGEVVDRLQEGILMRRVRYTLGGLFLLGCFYYLTYPQLDTFFSLPKMPVIFRIFGVLLLAASFFLYWWVHVSLGANFTDTVFVREHSFVVEQGPYRWVRHPMYSTALLVAVGTFLVTTNWLLGFLGVSLMVVIMAVRTPMEEKKLLQRHGEVYERYMSVTGKFFPKLTK